ncbi:unnamed protein product, partial [Brassica rapa]
SVGSRDGKVIISLKFLKERSSLPNLRLLHRCSWEERLSLNLTDLSPLLRSITFVRCTCFIRF